MIFNGRCDKIENVMTEQDLSRLKRRFLKYIGQYRLKKSSEQQNIELKRKHTFRVCREMGLICRGEGVNGNDALIAKAAALLHDIGRFPQYSEFKTFNDRISVNHGQLGADVLVKQNLLEGIGEKESENPLIIRAVKYHNTFAIPRLDRRSVFFLELVRDADKLDIWRVFVNYFAQPPALRASAAGLSLPGGRGVTEGIVPHILKNRIVPITLIKNLNDYKLLLISWVFGVNFRTTFRLFSNRRYARSIAAYLPDTAEIRQAVSHIEDFANVRAQNLSQG